MSGDTFYCHKEGKWGQGVLLASNRHRPGMLLIPTKHRTAPCKELPAPNVNSAEVEKPKFRYMEYNRLS